MYSPAAPGLGARRLRGRARAPGFTSAVPTSPVLWSKGEQGQGQGQGRGGGGGTQRWVFPLSGPSLGGGAVAGEGMRSRFRRSSARRSCLWSEGRERRGRGRGGVREEDGRQTAGVCVCNRRVGLGGCGRCGHLGRSVQLSPLVRIQHLLPSTLFTLLQALPHLPCG